MQARALFPPEPRSAADARHWVRDHLDRLGRHDLVPAAEAGVSELVTNGILHAQTSIGLQLSRRQDRVVIEVYDGSPHVQQPAYDSGAEVNESTIGRGLRIVRAYANEWGVCTTDHGKVIWFQPAATVPGPSSAPTGGVGNAGTAAEPATTSPGTAEPLDMLDETDLDAALEALAEAFPDLETAGASAVERASSPDDDKTVRVWLLGVPLRVVHHYRKRWLELVREMQLLALASPSPQQRMAQRFCDAANRVHSDLYRVERSSRGYTPMSDDGATIDAVFDVPRSRRQDFLDIRDMARELEQRWAGIELLFVHPGRQAVELREWWLGEFIKQIDGADPTPWTGDLQVRDEALLSGGEL
jgi:anti-sigma regulatory factor (Ser/Thr protein kinase)